ncbi:MAG TPA: dienelactone hydrolase family protein [Steroidobacteraceae bacterium]
MERKTAHDFDQELLILFDAYVHGALDRRGFLDKAAKYAVGGVTAAMLLDQLSPKFVAAQVIKPEDPRIKTQYVEYDSPKGYGKMRGYLAQPAKAAGKLPGILVIHENRGLNEHIEDVARRAALGGYIAIAPDGLSVAGGAPADQEAARDLFAKTDAARIAGDVLAGVAWLAGNPLCNGKIGAVGFCYGGGLALRAAIETEGVDAAVCFYGRQLSVEETQRLKVPVLLNYAGSDERINAGIPAFRTALDTVGVPYSLNMYPGTQHGFHNDSSAARYNEAAAKLAWSRTMDFFDTYLKT